MECDPEVVRKLALAADQAKAAKVDHIWDIIKIGVAFFFTTVCGAWLTSWFQRRNWAHQQQVIRIEKYDDKASKVFEEISGLLDQRLYRYRQIIYAFRSGKDDRVDAAFSDYREVLFKWNDKINHNYALIEKFFGKEMRRRLEHEINRDIIFIGTLLEREKKNAADKIGVSKIWSKIDDVNAKVYDFDLSMLEAISNRIKEIT